MEMENLLERFTDSYLPKGDILCRLPFGVSLEPLWQKLLDYRKTKAILLPLHNAAGMPLWYVQTNRMIEASVKLSEAAASADDSFDPYRAKITPELRQELYFTSFVEGAQIDLPDAMQFFEDNREPRNVQEQMLQNNRVAWGSLMHTLYRPLDDQIIRTLAFQLTEEMAGAADDYRKQDYIRIPAMAEESYIVPPAGQIPTLMAELFRFLARQDVHPLIQASAAQAFLLITRPFPDGDERLGRMVSYQILIHSGYSFFKNVSLSRLIARRSYAYFKAMREILRQENGGDVTYFMEYYLRLLSDAVDHIGECEPAAPIRKSELLQSAAIMQTQPPAVITQKPSPRVASVQFEQSRLTLNLTQEAQAIPALRNEPIEVAHVEEESLQKMPAGSAEVIQASPFVGNGSEQKDDTRRRTLLTGPYGAIGVFFILYHHFGSKQFSTAEAAQCIDLAHSTISRVFRILRVIGVLTAVEEQEGLWYELYPDLSMKKIHDCSMKDALANDRQLCLQIVECLRNASTDMCLSAKELQACTGLTSYRFETLIIVLRLTGAIKRITISRNRQTIYQYAGRETFDVRFIREVFTPMNSVEESINHAIGLLEADERTQKPSLIPCKEQQDLRSDTSDANAYPSETHAIMPRTKLEGLVRVLRAHFSEPFTLGEAQSRLRLRRSTLARYLISLSWAGVIFRYRQKDSNAIAYSFKKRPSLKINGVEYAVIDYTSMLNDFVKSIRMKCGDAFTMPQIHELTGQGKELIAVSVDAMKLKGLCTAERIPGSNLMQFRLADTPQIKEAGRSGTVGYESCSNSRIAAAATTPSGQTIQFR